MQWLVNWCCGSIQPLRLHKQLLALIAAILVLVTLVALCRALLRRMLV